MYVVFPKLCDVILCGIMVVIWHRIKNVGIKVNIDNNKINLEQKGKNNLFLIVFVQYKKYHGIHHLVICHSKCGIRVVIWHKNILKNKIKN